MVELVLLVCSLLNPLDCSYRQPAFESDYASMRSCLVQGQLAVVRWDQEHPGLTVRRWTCGAPQA